MIGDCLHRVAACRESLTREEARAVMAEILRGEATDAQIAGLLVALNMKGESVEEIVGFAEAIRSAATPLESLRTEAGALDVSRTEREALVDTCGTGGDVSGTFNIFTASVVTVAGAGAHVAKLRNRSVTSLCGSAVVVETLGDHVARPRERLGDCLRHAGRALLYG